MGEDKRSTRRVRRVSPRPATDYDGSQMAARWTADRQPAGRQRTPNATVPSASAAAPTAWRQTADISSAVRWTRRLFLATAVCEALGIRKHNIIENLPRQSIVTRFHSSVKQIDITPSVYFYTL